MTEAEKNIFTVALAIMVAIAGIWIMDYQPDSTAAISSLTATNESLIHMIGNRLDALADLAEMNDGLSWKAVFLVFTLTGGVIVLAALAFRHAGTVREKATPEFEIRMPNGEKVVVRALEPASSTPSGHSTQASHSTRAAHSTQGQPATPNRKIPDKPGNERRVTWERK